MLINCGAAVQDSVGLIDDLFISWPVGQLQRHCSMLLLHCSFYPYNNELGDLFVKFS